MSKRAGEFISAQDLLNEVDKDSIRFMMLNRSNDVELDFDFNKVKEKNKGKSCLLCSICLCQNKFVTRTLKINKIEKILVNSDNFILMI